LIPNCLEAAEGWLRLTLVPGLSPAAQRALLRALGAPDAVLAADVPAVAGIVGQRATERLKAGPDKALLDATLRWLAIEGHHLVTLADASYPRALLDIPDPPTVLYAIGRVELLNAASIAVVGSRNATAQGGRDAYAFARALSDAGLTIVSGLALGIDTHAHRGGLEGCSSSVAVMGTGADLVYPKGNRALAHELAAKGCLITEFALGTPSAAGNFPRRNRLISGLSRGVLVVEAAERSGSLITARLAGEQGRDVFAIPGSIHSSLSKGCHVLIKEGAKLVESAADVLAELGIAQESAAAPARGSDAPDDPLLDAMGFGPVTIDQIAQRVGGNAAAIGAGLARLQIEGRVAAMAGGRFQQIA
jgi:DNA processing protein